MRLDAVQAGSLRQLAYDEIRRMILDGELKPGEALAEKKLMEQLGIGRTPLREAFNQLIQEDVVEIAPRRGTFVRTLEAEDITALFQVRQELEPAIARIATSMAEAGVLEMFRASFSAGGDVAETIRLDGNFHRYLVRATHNHYFLRFMESVYFQNERVRGMSSRATENLSDTNREHLMIVERMLALDGAGAANAMAAHIAHARNTALAVVFEGIREG